MKKVNFNGVMYTLRYVNQLLFGSKTLQHALLDYDMIPRSLEAEEIDDMISTYVSDDILESTSDEELWGLIYKEPTPKDIYQEGVIYEEDLTDAFLNNWFLNLTIPNKQRVLANANGNWLNYNLAQKRIWYNTIAFKTI